MSRRLRPLVAWFAVGVIGLLVIVAGVSILRGISGRIDTYGACLSDGDAVAIYAANGTPDYAGKAVLFSVSLPTPQNGYEIAEADPELVRAVYATAARARGSMCSDVSVSGGKPGYATKAVSGLVSVESVVDPTTGLPAELRLVATDLVFEDGREISRIETPWVQVFGMPG